MRWAPDDISMDQTNDDDDSIASDAPLVVTTASESTMSTMTTSTPASKPTKPTNSRVVIELI